MSFSMFAEGKTVDIASGKSSVFYEDNKEAVDLLIVLAADVSGSITDPSFDALSEQGEFTENEYGMQTKGMVEALRDPEVSRILEQCSTNGVALTYMEWSGRAGGEAIQQRVGWTKITSGSDLNRFAGQIDNFTQRSSNGETDILSALRYSANLVENAPYQSARKIISISSDGKQSLSDIRGNGKDSDEVSRGRILHSERERLVSEGYTIDALVVLNDSSIDNSKGLPLKDYFREYIVGGPGHVLTPIEDFHDYAEGFKTKLMRELNNCIY